MPACYLCNVSYPALTMQEDHFPRPRSMGGEHTLPVCMSCHDAKDRILLANWDPDAVMSGLMGLWQKANTAERLLLAKVFHIMAIGATSGPLDDDEELVTHRSSRRKRPKEAA